MNNTDKKTKLSRLLELQTLPFYSTSHSQWTDEDRKNSDEYESLTEELSNAAKSLKKGDRVQFMQLKKIKGTSRKAFLFDTKPAEFILLEGVVHQPVKHVKKSMLVGTRAEDAGDYVREFNCLKVLSGDYIYTLNPEDVCFIGEEVIPTNVIKAAIAKSPSKSEEEVIEKPFSSLSKSAQDGIIILIQNILGVDVKTAAIRNYIKTNSFEGMKLTTTYDDVYYSLQRVQRSVSVAI